METLKIAPVPLYTSVQILDPETGEDTMYTIQEKVCSFGSTIDYVMTEGELHWLQFVKNRYSIYDYMMKHLHTLEISGKESEVLRIADYEELSMALDADCRSAGKAVCLSDETALQRIFFWLYQEQEDESEDA